jgi:hypothetical protein
VINTNSFLSDLNELAKQLTAKTPNISSIPPTPGKDTTASTHRAVLEPPKELLNYLKLLQVLLVKNDANNIEDGKNQIKVHSDTVKMKQEEASKALQASIAAQKKAESSNVFANIFGWIAAAVTAVVGVVMMASGVGAPAGAVMMVLAIDQMGGMATGTSMMGEATKGIATGLEQLGMDPTAANILASVLVLVIAVVATAGANSAWSAAKSTYSKMTGSAASSAKVSPLVASTAKGSAAAASSATGSSATAGSAAAATESYMNTIIQGGQIIAASTQMAGAATNMKSAVHKHEADLADVNRARIEKVILQQRDALETLIKQIKESMANRESTINIMSSTLTQADNSMKKLVRITA